MPYHVFARAEGHFSPPEDCNLETEDEILQNYCIPYLEGKPITIAGTKLIDKQIKALVIFLSDFTSFELVQSAPYNIQQMKGQGREYEVIRKSEATYNITSDIMKKARDSIGGNITSSEIPSKQPASINFYDSVLNNSSVAGIMDHSTVNITVNKSAIEDWLSQITSQLKENNVQNEDIKNAIDTLSFALQAPKPSGTIIKLAVEGIKAIGLNLISSAAWQHLMTHPLI